MLRFLVLVLALVIGGMSAWLAFQRLPAQAPQSEAVPEAEGVETGEVLVAAARIPGGSALAADLLRWQLWPLEGATADGLILREASPQAIADLAGSVARATFVPGEPIQRDKLAATDSGFLAAQLPDGKRAIAVRISAENTAGGFVLPDDYVDVIHTRPAAAAGGPGVGATSASSTIAHNIRVLAIDQIFEGTGTDVTVVGRTATLEVEPEQVELIAAAQASGTLSLALRPARNSGALAGPPPRSAPDPEPAVETVPDPRDNLRDIRILSPGSARVITTRARAER